jgi:hypothetical protein
MRSPNIHAANVINRLVQAPFAALQRASKGPFVEDQLP